MWTNQVSIDLFKNNYSWLQKGVNTIVLNEGIMWKTTLIFTDRSTDEWSTVVMIWTVNSLKLCVFLKLLEFILSEDLYESVGLQIILLDNSKIHSFKFTKKVIKQLT